MNGHARSPVSGVRGRATSSVSALPSRHGKTPTPRNGQDASRSPQPATPRKMGSAYARQPGQRPPNCARRSSRPTAGDARVLGATFTMPSCSPSTTSAVAGTLTARLLVEVVRTSTAGCNGRAIRQIFNASAAHAIWLKRTKRSARSQARNTNHLDFRGDVNP